MSHLTWVCPHDPTGIDPDTGTYCPQAQRLDLQSAAYSKWREGVARHTHPDKVDSVFVVEDVFQITGRGTVVTGKHDGLVKTGDFYALGNGLRFQIRGVESHCVTWGTDKGMPVGLLLGKVDEILFPRGTKLYRS